MLRFRVTASSSPSSSSSVVASVRKTTCSSGALFRSTCPLLFKYSALDDYYYQESYESLQKFNSSTTYPGSIKAATPGDTQMYFSKFQTVLEEGDKHYWRPVVDDPEPKRYVTVRIRFKEDVCTGDNFEIHSNVVPVRVPVDSTISYVIQAATEINDSPYVALNSFSLVLNGKSLHPAQTLEDAGVLVGKTIADDSIGESMFGEEEEGEQEGEKEGGGKTEKELAATEQQEEQEGESRKGTTTRRRPNSLVASEETFILDAVDDIVDHRSHEAPFKPLNWFEDEITPEIENTAPYAELKLRENITVPTRSPKTYRMHGKPPLSRYGIQNYGSGAKHL